MKIVMFFAPAVMPVSKAFAKEMKARDPDNEIIGIASTRLIVEQLRNSTDVTLDRIICLEDEERSWLEASVDPVPVLKRFEEKLGIKTLRNFIVADRHLGAGYVTGAEPIDSELYRKTRSSDGVNTYLAGMMEFFDRFLEDEKPDAYFAYVIASGPMLCLATLCQDRGIFLGQIVHTRVDDRVLIDTTIRGLMAPVWATLKAGHKISPETQKKVTAWLSDYRRAMSQPDYVSGHTSDNAKLLSYSGALKKFFKSILRAFFYETIKKEPIPLRGKGRWQDVKHAMTVPFKTWRTARSLKFADAQTLSQKRYIYFPLHVDPEASTEVLAPEHVDQLKVMDAVSRNMPSGFELVVKEHPAMIGLRPGGYYSRIQDLPNTVLLNAAVSNEVILKNADLILTITGTAGWEGLLLGKPVVTVGDVFYNGFENGVFHCPELSGLDQAIDRALSATPISDEELRQFLGHLYEHSFSLPTEIFWYTPLSDIKGNDWQIVARLTDAFLERYNAFLK